MKTKGMLRFAVTVAVMLWFAGCDVIMGFLGDENLGFPGGQNPPSEPKFDSEFDPSVPSFYVSGTETGSDDNDGLTEDSPFKTLARAYAATLGSDDRKRIVVLSNLSKTGLVTLKPGPGQEPGGVPVLIEGATGGLKIERSDGANDSVLAIEGGAIITFQRITVNGKRLPDNDTENANNRALAISGDGTVVTLGNGTVVTGKKYSSGGVASALSGSGIRVYNSAKLVMKGGSAVTGCVGLVMCAGAVMVQSAGTLEMEENARIFGNVSSSGGGVVCVGSSVGRSTFIMKGGEISGNTATFSNLAGGGMYLSSADFTMKGGKISGNKATGSGGGVVVQSSSFTMENGEISGNEAGSGGGVYVAPSTNVTFTMTGGVIYGNENEHGDLRNTAPSAAAFYRGIYVMTILPPDLAANLLVSNDGTIDRRVVP